MERKERHMGIPPSGESDGGVGTARGGYLRLLMPQQSCTVYCNHDHYGLVSGGGAETLAKGDQLVVRTGRIGYIVDKYGVSGGMIDGWWCSNPGA